MKHPIVLVIATQVLKQSDHTILTLHTLYIHVHVYIVVQFVLLVQFFLNWYNFNCTGLFLSTV